MLTLITGGSGSGKSEYAENAAVRLGGAKKYYLATMASGDREAREKIRRHQMMRDGKGFETIECACGLDLLELPVGDCVLLECLSNLAANEMFMNGRSKPEVRRAVINGIINLKKSCSDVMIVTNEIFSDGIEYEGETRTYLECLGEMNREVAAMADQVVEVVFGIPVFHKGGRT